MSVRNMNSEVIYEQFGQEAYFFVLKKVKDTSIANDVLQNAFLKIHKNIHQLKAEQKVRAWVFQICRNEIANYFNKESAYQNGSELDDSTYEGPGEHICCFDRFIEELPENFQQVIELAYIQGKPQEQVAETLGISLANVKARVRRAKAQLKKRFLDCCKYETNAQGQLVGSPDCSVCR